MKLKYLLRVISGVRTNPWHVRPFPERSLADRLNVVRTRAIMRYARSLPHDRFLERLAMHFPIPALGGCNCGSLRYRVTKEPLTSYICHCHLCQKRTGSAFSMSIVCPADGLQLEKGEPVKTERALANGSKNYAYVCAKCHSRLYTQRDGSPMINLRTGTLDDTSHIRPVAQIWTSSAQAWAVVNVDDILTYSGQPADFGALVSAWKATR
jgi:hypothetical protein